MQKNRALFYHHTETHRGDHIQGHTGINVDSKRALGDSRQKTWQAWMLCREQGTATSYHTVKHRKTTVDFPLI